MCLCVAVEQQTLSCHRSSWITSLMELLKYLVQSVHISLFVSCAGMLDCPPAVTSVMSVSLTHLSYTHQPKLLNGSVHPVSLHLFSLVFFIEHFFFFIFRSHNVLISGEKGPRFIFEMGHCLSSFPCALTF